MATTKFYLDMRGKATDGKKPILINIFHNRTTATVSTGIRIVPSEWNGAAVIKRHDSSILNAKLSKMKSDIDNAIARFSFAESFDSITATDIKHLIFEKKNNIDRTSISFLFDEYLKQDLSDGTKSIYRTTEKKVLNYGGQKIKINAITTKWLFGFEQYLSKTQKSANGRSIILRCLHAVCSYAKKIGIASNDPFDNFHIKSEVTEKRNIEIDRFVEFIKYPTSPKNNMYRDYFMLLFYLIGVNTIDILTAKKSSVVDGRFEYVRAKTHKRYSIKIQPEAQEIIDRYSGKGEYLLDALDHCKLYRSFVHQMNDALKKIGPVVEETVPNPDDLFGEPVTICRVQSIVPNISTYFARHTWATLAADLDISTDVIAQALGHSNVNRTTMIYIKPNQSKVDDANRKVIDYLLMKSE